MLRVCVLVLVLSVLVLSVQVRGSEDVDDVEVLRPVRRTRSLFSRRVTRFLGLGGGQHCGPPESCPPHACRLDDAVVHGFCCGCSLPTDRVQVRCPPWLRCPLSPIPLCDDYNFMMDCCC